MARKNIFDAEVPATGAVSTVDANKERPRSDGARAPRAIGALGAISQSLSGIAERSRRAEEIESRFAGAEAVLEIDPGLIDPSFAPAVNPLEVDEVFETPFTFLMDPANHRLDEREWQGRMRKFYVMPHEGHYIWGATAGILRNLYERLFS